MLFAYFGPETILPLTSVIAGVAGIFLMLGRNSVRLFLLPFRALFGKGKAGSTTESPSTTTPAGPHSSALERRRAQAARGRVQESSEGSSD